MDRVAFYMDAKGSLDVETVQMPEAGACQTRGCADERDSWTIIESGLIANDD